MSSWPVVENETWIGSMSSDLRIVHVNDNRRESCGDEYFCDAHLLFFLIYIISSLVILSLSGHFPGWLINKDDQGICAGATRASGDCHAFARQPSGCFTNCHRGATSSQIPQTHNTVHTTAAKLQQGDAYSVQVGVVFFSQDCFR